VRGFLPEDATIIPGHGRPMCSADIEFPLRYLRELDGAVRAAIDARSIEATLEVATMPCYGAYSLFEWAQNTVNVPAAYRDLQNTATVEISGRSTQLV
jgi:cyclase